MTTKREDLPTRAKTARARAATLWETYDHIPAGSKHKPTAHQSAARASRSAHKLEKLLAKQLGGK